MSLLPNLAHLREQLKKKKTEQMKQRKTLSGLKTAPNRGEIKAEKQQKVNKTTLRAVASVAKRDKNEARKLAPTAAFGCFRPHSSAQFFLVVRIEIAVKITIRQLKYLFIFCL